MLREPMVETRFGLMIEGLVERGWFAGEDLVPMACVRSLDRDARDVWGAGNYHAAGVGHDHGHTVEPEIRGDSICWIDEQYETEALRTYRASVEEMRLELNRELYLGLESIEIQFARYAAGAHYDRHIDRFSDRALRTISCILYLNHDWMHDDGGELRLHLDVGVHDIAPRAGTWVVFRSELIEHEVRPAKRERFSLTGWFRRRALNPLLSV